MAEYSLYYIHSIVLVNQDTISKVLTEHFYPPDR